MIYLLGMPTKVVIGTSLFQVTFVAAFTTMMHAITNQDSLMLCWPVFLIIGGVIGAQIGTRVGLKAGGQSNCASCWRWLVLAVCGKIAFDLLWPPGELYSISVSGGV